MLCQMSKVQNKEKQQKPVLKETFLPLKKAHRTLDVQNLYLKPPNQILCLQGWNSIIFTVGMLIFLLPTNHDVKSHSAILRMSKFVKLVDILNIY